MALSRDAMRRRLGGVCLAISASMLVLGMTLFKGLLRLETFFFYWLFCILMTGITLIIALLDMRAVRMKSRREQRELMNRALLEIKKERDERAARAKQNEER